MGRGDYANFTQNTTYPDCVKTFPRPNALPDAATTHPDASPVMGINPDYLPDHPKTLHDLQVGVGRGGDLEGGKGP